MAQKMYNVNILKARTHLNLPSFSLFIQLQKSNYCFQMRSLLFFRKTMFYAK